MTDSQQHWQKVYTQQPPKELSWFQAQPEPSLTLIECCGAGPEDAVLDVGGGTSGLAGKLLLRGYRNVHVLDISQAALDAARAALGGRADRIHWHCADLLAFEADTPIAIWHDRAVFHFLVDPELRARYRQRMHASLAANGHVVVATFAPDGPEQCSGLPVQRYAADTLAKTLDLELIRAEHEIHRTPGGFEQSFTYALMRKRP